VDFQFRVNLRHGTDRQTDGQTDGVQHFIATINCALTAMQRSNNTRCCWGFALQSYTLCPIKTCEYIFYNNFNNKCPITIIFGIVSSQYRRHRKMVSFPTSPI